MKKGQLHPPHQKSKSKIKNHERNVKNNDLSMHWSKIIMQSALNIDLMISIHHFTDLLI